jgi:hypothetical protein
VLFIVFLAVSIYLFGLSLSIISKYRMVSYVNMTGFLIDSAISVMYLLFASMLLLLAGIMLYGATASALKCSDI